ncbi:hypothetical protein AVEN_177293-1 [Araneus ventricosus]|uniref:Transposase Tc1-like domain-containing protein n=1 Tax=Araneus ventricosus TaxID=182803 RepID=A0A4Y2C4H2_ARAVE|nr:hypothetical protein AVEN_177293-1 [Araneus ventricosus]
MNRERPARTLDIEENVLHQVQQTLSLSTRSVAHAVEISRSSVWTILRENEIHPYHVQRIQTLQPGDYEPRIAFAQWYLEKCVTDSILPTKVLFTDEASFTREGIFNTHNAHFWVVENPHATRPRADQSRFSVNVWAGIEGDHLIGPYLMPFRLTGSNYFICLQQVLPQLLGEEHISASTRQNIWFQHQGPLPISAVTFISTKTLDLANSESDVVVRCVGLLDHRSYHVLISFYGGV